MKITLNISVLLWFLCLWVTPSRVQALTLGDVKVQVRQIIDDRQDPKLRYSDTMLLHFINEGHRDIVNRSWCLQKTTSTALTVRTTYYSLPTDLIAIQEVNFKETTTGRTRQLEEKHERSLLQENPDYERESGAPMYYLVRNSTSSATVLEFGITPIPSTSSVLGTVLIDYYNQPTDMSANSDIPLDSLRHLYPYHSALVYYTAWKIKMIQGEMSAAESFMKLYDQIILLMIDRLGRMPNYNPGFGASTPR